jgi:hypothetical protein
MTTDDGDGRWHDAPYGTGGRRSGGRHVCGVPCV